MTSRLPRALLAALLAAALSPVMQARAADDPAAYFESDCVDCHHMKRKPLEKLRLTREEWLASIEKMVQLDKLDPVPSKAFMATLADWLARTHGPASPAQ